MTLDERYVRNMNMLTVEENHTIQQSCVAVIGCGGLGGCIIEMLARVGVGKIIAVDGDVFDRSNLNRQILSHQGNIGEKKAEEAKKRMNVVNPDVEILGISEHIDEKNGRRILKDVQVLVDATDGIKTRLMLQQLAEDMEIAMVHGAIAGWYGQVTTILPGDATLNSIYPESTKDKGIEKDLGNPSFTPALVGSIQVSEVIKLLINRGEILRQRMLYIDLYEHDYTLLELSQQP